MQFSQFFALAAILAVTLTAGSRVRIKEEVAAEHTKKAQTSQSNPKASSAPGLGEAWAGWLEQEAKGQMDPEVYDDEANTCSRDAEKICPQCKLVLKTAKCEDYRAGDKVDVENFPIRLGLESHGLPEEIQGVFWLTNQGAGSSLVSFGQNADGGGLSVLAKNADGGGVGKVRTAGDRVWSWSDLGLLYGISEKIDLIYNFNFDSITAPRKCKIYPDARNYGIKGNKYTEWILNFEMELLQCPRIKDPTAEEDPYCREMIPEFQDSYVWQRKSYAFGHHLKSADYQAVQVIKADGTKLPAFDKWIDFCVDAVVTDPVTSVQSDPVTGVSPGVFHYHEIDNSKTCPSWACRHLHSWFC